MAMRTRVNNDTTRFIVRSGPMAEKFDAVIAQDAGRSGALAPYTLMGEISSVIGAVVDGTNTGNGTVTVPTLATGGPAMVGLYALEVITAGVTHGGTFQLSDPNGVILDSNIQMTDAAGSVLVYSGHGIGFTITEGTTNFIVGDDFTIEVTAGSGFLPLEVDAVNGLEKVAGIYYGEELTEAAIKAGTHTGRLMLIGDLFFNEDMLVLEGSVDLDDILQSGLSVRKELAALGIHPVENAPVSAIENT